MYCMYVVGHRTRCAIKKFRRCFFFLISLQPCSATSIQQHHIFVKYTTLIDDCINKRKIMLMKSLLIRSSETNKMHLCLNDLLGVKSIATKIKNVESIFDVTCTLLTNHFSPLKMCFMNDRYSELLLSK